MRLRRTVPIVMSCAAVALAGCGDSKLLGSATAGDLQDTLASVQRAIDDGDCSQARTLASDGASKVDSIDGIDSDLRDNLRTGFQTLLSKVRSDCDSSSTKAPTTTTETTTDVAPPTTDPVDPDPVDPGTTTDDTTTDPGTTTDDGTTTDPSGGTGSGSGSGSGGSGTDDGSGGVTPGVDGPGAGERSAPPKGIAQRLHDLRKKAERYFKGQGPG